MHTSPHDPEASYDAITLEPVVADPESLREERSRLLLKVPSELIAAKRGTDRERFDRSVAGIRERTLDSLLPSLETQTDPAMLWPIHTAFEAGGIPPILRGPRHQLGSQGDFFDLAADVMWLQTRHPDVLPRYSLWQAIFQGVPGTPVWWDLLLQHYRRAPMSDTRSLTIGLRLRDMHRQHLRTIQTASVRRLFEDLHGSRFGEFCETLKAEIGKQPDKSGRVSVRESASRRARIFRLHQLSRSTFAGTAELWAKLTGEQRSAQAMRDQVLKALPVFQQLTREWRAKSARVTDDVPPAVIPEV